MRRWCGGHAQWIGMGRMTKRRAQRTYREPIAYEVGKDVTQQQYEELLAKVADWFREWRPEHKEPAADARARIRACLEGKKMDGSPWYSHWGSSFATRMKMLCRFDVDKMTPIRTGDPAKRAAKQKAKDKATQARLANTATNDERIPELTRKELDGRVNYGDKALPITEAELEFWRKTRDAYLAEFPQLRSVNAQGELGMLCDLAVVHERNRLKLLEGKGRVDGDVMIDTAKAITELKKALGIHPDQLAKRAKEEERGSIAEAVAKFEAMPDEVKDRFLAEELLILYQQYCSVSPRDDMGGYQLDDVGLFGATRCRTCHCAKCGTRNFAGFTITEIEEYLREKGWLKPVQASPETPVAVSQATPEPLADGADAHVE